MSDSTKILVLGATGAVGKEVCIPLAKKKIGFRAAVHKIEKADSITSLGSNIEAIEVDVYNPASLEKALKGIEIVFFMSPPGQTKSGYGVLTAMKKAGVKYIVKLSALSCEDIGKGTYRVAREHGELEDEIKKEGIPFVSLRPTGFMTNFLYKASIKNEGTITEGMGGNVKFNFIDPRDIGEVAAVCLENPSKYAGKAINITGPDTISNDDAAKIFSEELGKPIKFVELSESEVREEGKKKSS